MTEQDVQDIRYGEVKIANDVIAVIAGMALCDIQGVYIDGKAPEVFIDKSNTKNITRAVKIEVLDGDVAVNIIISVEYGKILGDICVDVQDKIKAAIQTMTGLEVSRVDVTVEGLVFKKEK